MTMILDVISSRFFTFTIDWYQILIRWMRNIWIAFSFYYLCVNRFFQNLNIAHFVLSIPEQFVRTFLTINYYVSTATAIMLINVMEDIDDLILNVVDYITKE